MICGKYHRNTGYLLRNVDAGTQEFTGMGNCVDDVQMRRTDELVDDVMSGSHKSIAQMNCTNESPKTR